MSRKDSVCEDEWSEIQQRFEKEGLDFENLGPEERLLHVWRWLVDAESNLRSTRRQLDKLRDLRSEEMEEMENYIGHIRDLAEKRADHLENETITLRSKLESSQEQAATLASLLEKSGLQCIADDSLGEQVAFLIADRAKLMEEIEVLKKLGFSNDVNGVSKDGDLLSEIIKVSSEKEVLRREVNEMCDRVQLLEKASRQLELDNERLAFKLSEALAELEEREAQLKHLVNGGEQTMQSAINLLWPAFKPGDSPHPPPRRSFSLQPQGDSPKGSLKKGSSPRNSFSKMYSDPQKLHPHRSVSPVNGPENQNQEKASREEGQREETGTQTENEVLDNKESEIQKSLSLGDKDVEMRSQSFGADSTPPSLMMSEFSCGSPKKLAGLLDSQMATSRGELMRLEEIKKLQAECENLRAQLATVTEKYNALALRHIQYKAKRKAQIDELRSRFDAELSSLQCQVENLQSQLSVQKKMLSTEESLRSRVETDYRQIQEEKRALMVNAMHLETAMREKEREITALGKKILLLENANSDLLAKVLQLKYSTVRQIPKNQSAMPKSNSVEGVLMDLGSV
ncbi:MAP7 domain-containing protein 1-like isoform X2 [Schistocerca gregaria]|uniref:MAP7 domain-containing protein 1-like n=1 Tax=Schistocerca cancellata TaxID=274614 RepID=UPI002117B80D|nr:MAP7 domain-containing protein 1-like [Schistocerca cancellata]XP_049857863.1 MAP7 domain-containing protein 1-like isoform X2 [Schistocerca gregaria]